VREPEHLNSELEALGVELRRLPTPMPAEAVVWRVRRLAHLQLAERADERLSRMVLVSLLVFSWTVTLVSLLVVRLLSGGNLTLLGGTAGPALYLLSTWISGAAVLVLLGFHVRKERSLA
jgi:hypothetical protein